MCTRGHRGCDETRCAKCQTYWRFVEFINWPNLASCDLDNQSTSPLICKSNSQIPPQYSHGRAVALSTCVRKLAPLQIMKIAGSLCDLADLSVDSDRGCHVLYHNEASPQHDTGRAPRSLSLFLPDEILLHRLPTRP